MRKRTELGNYVNEGTAYDVWLETGPSDFPRSSSRQLDGTWKTDAPRDYGPSLHWRSASGPSLGVQLADQLRIVVDVGRGIQLGPAELDELPPPPMPAEQAAKFTAAALEKLTRQDGHFEVRWVPNDPNLPF